MRFAEKEAKPIVDFCQLPLQVRAKRYTGVFLCVSLVFPIAIRLMHLKPRLMANRGASKLYTLPKFVEVTGLVSEFWVPVNYFFTLLPKYVDVVVI